MKLQTSYVGLVIAAVSLAAALPCRAQEGEPLITDRPDFTESPQSVPKGRLQLEGGYTFTRTGAVKQHDVGELLLRVGTGARSELRLGFSSYSWLESPGGDASGFQDTSLGVKFYLAEGSEAFDFARPSIGLILETSLPTGNDVFGEDALQPEAKLLFGWDLNERWSMASNLNYGLPVENGERFGQFSGSLTFGLSLNEKLGSYFEYFGFVPGSEGGPNAHYVNTGLTYLVHNDLQLDFRVGKGLNGIGNDYFIGAGAARRW
ncbi:MAG: transporter [Armatimonadetes bacterium]|nr:transporter [Armatimonadota bacterium]